MPRLIPLHDYVLVKVDPPGQEGLVVKLETLKDYSPVMATVIDIGDQVNMRELVPANAIHWRVDAGDRILIDNRHVGTPIKAEEGDLTMIHSRLILGVIR